MTEAEAAAVDLPGRSRRADRADKAVRPVARTLRGFAGLYQDQLRGGVIVVRMTHSSDTDRAALEAAAEPGDLVVESGAASTLLELEAAMYEVLARSDRLMPGIAVWSTGVDEAAGRLAVGVETRDVEAAKSMVASLEASLGVPVAITPAEQPHNQACDAVGRTTCFSPMKVGVLVRRGAPTRVNCTMGFHVQLKTNTATKGFLTSGHCSWGASTSWYMDGWAGPSGTGFIGSVAKTRYKDLGEDCMVVGMPSTQVTRSIYDTSRAVAGTGSPVQGEVIYMSAGMSDELYNTNIINSTVLFATTSYVSDAPNPGYRITAAQANQWRTSGGALWDTQDGDSGSPVYRAPSSGGAIAVGLHSTTQHHFARVKDCMDNMGYSIY